MNKNPSPCNVVFSYLLILVIPGLAMLGGADRTVAHDPVYTDRKALEDTLAAINAEANLPIYSTPLEPALLTAPAAGGPQAAAAIHSVAGAQVPAKKSDVSSAWHIHLASLSARDEADRLVEHARAKGIDATQEHVEVNGKRYWRVLVKGFQSRDEAKSHAMLLKDKLGLRDFWISRESGPSRSSNASSVQKLPATQGRG